MRHTAQISVLLEDISTNNSQSAFKSLYLEYSDRIMRYILMYVNNKETAEELVSDVFMAIWENRSKLLEIKEFDAYIYKITRYKTLNYLRIERPKSISIDETPLNLFAYTETTPEDDMISRETIEQVNSAIEQLPPKAKIAFKLVREDGMKYHDAAEHLSISIKTLEAHLTSAMKKIVQVLGKN